MCETNEQSPIDMNLLTTGSPINMKIVILPVSCVSMKNSSTDSHLPYGIFFEFLGHSVFEIFCVKVGRRLILVCRLTRFTSMCVCVCVVTWRQ